MRVHRLLGVNVAIGNFGDPNFPAPTIAVWEESRHPWISLPPAAGGRKPSLLAHPGEQRGGLRALRSAGGALRIHPISQAFLM